MLRVFLLVGILLLCGSVRAQEGPREPDDSAEFQVLFNGEDLTGWDGDPDLWCVKDGVIHGETTPEKKARGNTVLIWDGGEVQDFELRLAFRCNATNNSGVQYRSKRLEDSTNNWVVKGYQHEVRNENKLPNVSGFIYDEKGNRGRLTTVGEKVDWNENGKQVIEKDLISQDEFDGLMKLDDWNEIIIVARGNHIKHYLNGTLVTEFTDQHPTLALSEGVIALQLHGGKPMWAEFKDIKLRRIEADSAETDEDSTEE